MKTQNSKNFLPKKAFDREALTHLLLNIKPIRLPRGFKRLSNISSKVTFLSFLVLFLLGYFPSFKFPPIEQSRVQAQEQAQSQEIIAKSFPQPVILPHPGYLSTRFSSYHPGIDIPTGLGMPIHPITAGVVEQVNMGFWGYGNHVIISHPDGFKSLYGHMGRVYAKAGESVTSENIIGDVGMTGNTSGPHTHLEITHNGAYIDPLTIIPELPTMPKPEFLTPYNASTSASAAR